jgi:type IV pilus assembly protein PilA
MRPARRSRAGFTLIELMITVGIVGVLAVLATYGVNKYLANAKSAEARNSIGVIAAGAAAQYEKESMGANVLGAQQTAAISRQLCLSASVSVPASAAAIQGRKYQSSTAEWDADKVGNSGFSCLKFRLDEPQYFMYSYTVAGSALPGSSFTAAAQGDLNGDGVLSLFTITGSINSSYTLNIAPNILEVRPEE